MEITSVSSEENRGPTADQTPAARDVDVLNQVISALKSLPGDARERILQTVLTFFQFLPARPLDWSLPAASSQPGTHTPTRPPFSQDLSMSAKEFLLEKQPKTDVERIACLAFYLTHYRNTPHFKTIDLSSLNTEAAQPKFANAAWAANNALKLGYLVPASRGHRQLSGAGERFVRALPDRDAARAILATIRPKRSRKNIRNQDEQ
jgi:hypothetical protein